MAKVKIIKTKRRAKATKVVKKKTVRRKKLIKNKFIAQKRNKLGQFARVSPWATLIKSPWINIAFTKALKQFSLKILAVALIVSLNGLGLSQIGYTLGYYNDKESSNENIFTGGMLDIVLSNTEFDGVVSNNSGDQSQFETNVSLVDGSLPTQYDVEYEMTGGSVSMCNVLALNATHNVLLYSGALSAFSVSTTTDFGLWSFAVSVLPTEQVIAGERCEFDLVFKAWIDGVPSFQTSGYNDEERFHIVIESAEVETPVVINEFLPHPDGPLCSDPENTSCDSSDPDFIFDFGSDSSDMPEGEWVELYNLTGSPVDLFGWYTQDASGGVGNTDITNLNTLSGTTIIPANGYLVVYMNKPVWNNTGDTVKLFNASDVLQDSYAYTSDYDYCYLIPTPGEINDEVASGGDIDCTPGATIPKNKSYARIPNGTGAFVDPIPTPGLGNSLNEEEALRLLEQYEGLFTLPIDTEINYVSETVPKIIIGGTESNFSENPSESVTEEIIEEATAEETVIEEVVEIAESIEEDVVVSEESLVEETLVEVMEVETIPEPTLPTEALPSEVVVDEVVVEAPAPEPIIVPEPVVESQPIPTPEPAPEPAPAPVESAPAPAE